MSSSDPRESGRGLLSRRLASERRRSSISRARTPRPAAQADAPWSGHASPEAWRKARRLEVERLALSYYRGPRLGGYEDYLVGLLVAYGATKAHARQVLAECRDEVAHERACERAA